MACRDLLRLTPPRFKEPGLPATRYKINAYYAYDDFQELANRLGLHPGRFKRFMQSAVNKEPGIFSLIDRSTLSEECKQAYKDSVRDSLRALSYSFAESHNRASH